MSDDPLPKKDKWQAKRTKWASEDSISPPPSSQSSSNAAELDRLRSARAPASPAAGPVSWGGAALREALSVVLWPAELYLHVLLQWYALLYSTWVACVSHVIPLLFDPPAPPPDRLLRPPRGPPGPSDEARRWLVGRSATQLAQCLRDRQITSAELVQMHIDQLQRTNAGLNAAVNQRFQQALEQAQQADVLLQSHRPGDELPPLLGVPFSVKECLAFKGMPHTSGLLARTRNPTPTAPALAVARAMEAGAIPLCFTNCSELCMWLETYNHVYGLTRNPYSPGRTAGGSSGGEAALVAAACVPFGLGSDVGGSIRLPASFCGVFGHKCSGGLIPTEGHYPQAGGRARDLLVVGPIARHAEDLSLLVRVLSSQPGGARGGLQRGGGGRLNVSRLRVTVFEAPTYPLTRPVSAEVIEAQSRAAQYLARRGAHVTYMQMPRSLSRGLDLWSGTMLLASNETRCTRQQSFAEAMTEDARLRGDHGGVSTWALCLELMQWARGRSCHTFPALALALVEQIPPSIPVGLCGGKAGVARLREEMEEELRRLLTPPPDEDACVILCPTYPSVAQRHFEPYLTPADFTHTAIWNVLEVPVTQVPLGLDKQGLPLGMQIVGPRGKDAWTLQVAEELERGGVARWVPPAGCGLLGAARPFGEGGQDE